jgi:Uma2 family endonuclease
VTSSTTWRHQHVLGNLLVALADYTKSHRIGWVIPGPAEIQFSTRRLVKPDLCVLPWAERFPESWSDVSSLVLAIEVVEENTARADRVVKRRLYQDEGVGEYWIVDLDARLIERWCPTDTRPEVLDTQIVWAPREGVPPLTIALDAVFEPEDTDEVERAP